MKNFTELFNHSFDNIKTLPLKDKVAFFANAISKINSLDKESFKILDETPLEAHERFFVKQEITTSINNLFGETLSLLAGEKGGLEDFKTIFSQITFSYNPSTLLKSLYNFGLMDYYSDILVYISSNPNAPIYLESGTTTLNKPFTDLFKSDLDLVSDRLVETFNFLSEPDFGKYSFLSDLLKAKKELNIPNSIFVKSLCEKSDIKNIFNVSDKKELLSFFEKVFLADDSPVLEGVYLDEPVSELNIELNKSQSRFINFLFSFVYLYRKDLSKKEELSMLFRRLLDNPNFHKFFQFLTLNNFHGDDRSYQKAFDDLTQKLFDNSLLLDVIIPNHYFYPIDKYGDNTVFISGNTNSPLNDFGYMTKLLNGYRKKEAINLFHVDLLSNTLLSPNLFKIFEHSDSLKYYYTTSAYDFFKKYDLKNLYSMLGSKRLTQFTLPFIHNAENKIKNHSIEDLANEIVRQISEKDLKHINSFKTLPRTVNETFNKNIYYHLFFVDSAHDEYRCEDYEGKDNNNAPLGVVEILLNLNERLIKRNPKPLEKELYFIEQYSLLKTEIKKLLKLVKVLANERFTNSLKKDIQEAVEDLNQEIERKKLLESNLIKLEHLIKDNLNGIFNHTL